MGPSDYSVVGPPRSYNSHGLLVQKNSTVFLSPVNATLSRMARDGRLQKLHEKWFAPMDVSLSPVLGTVLNVIAIPEGSHWAYSG
jgi:glutamate/aspartate transport system substrate-binding protein